MSHDHHDHGHAHAHNHGVSADARQGYLMAALVVLGLFMVGEIVVALATGSLALLSDAGHMLSDVGALVVALIVVKISARPANGVWTWGWKRAEILSAAGNGATLLVIGLLVGYEAINRLITPPPVAGLGVMIVAVIGIVVNVVVAWLVARANRSSLNVEGAYQHILTDLFGFIGTAIAGVVMMLTGWTRADAIASLVVCALMLHAAWGLLRAATRILLEAAPDGVNLDDVRSHLLAMEHVESLHDLHAWSISSDLPALSVHLVVNEGCFHDGHAPQLLAQMQECLHGHFDLEHSTFQLEPPTHRGRELAMH